MNNFDSLNKEYRQHLLSPDPIGALADACAVERQRIEDLQYTGPPPVEYTYLHRLINYGDIKLGNNNPHVMVHLILGFLFDFVQYAHGGEWRKTEVTAGGYNIPFSTFHSDIGLTAFVDFIDYHTMHS